MAIGRGQKADIHTYHVPVQFPQLCWLEHLIHSHLNCNAGMLQITVVGSMCTH